jgi:hypothetical protein
MAPVFRSRIGWGGLIFVLAVGAARAGEDLFSPNAQVLPAGRSEASASNPGSLIHAEHDPDFRKGVAVVARLETAKDSYVRVFEFQQAGLGQHGPPTRMATGENNNADSVKVKEMGMSLDIR